MLSLSDSAILLSTLASEQEALYNSSKVLSQRQFELHQKFMGEMQRLSKAQEVVLRKLAEVDKGIAIAYSERSCCLTY